VLLCAPGEARDVPVVDDRIVGWREQEGPHVRDRAVARSDAAEEHPLAVVTAARERPATREPEAAVHALHLPRRRVRRADEYAGVLPPDVPLCRLGEEPELPVVDPDHAD